ncbi:MAG: hypothetical protein IKO34_00735 [Bacteroidales bacterium]|nr:hypothetical protein [Bacteroidales bacterium]
MSNSLAEDQSSCRAASLLATHHISAISNINSSGCCKKIVTVITATVVAISFITVITHWYQASNSFSKEAVLAHTFQNPAATTGTFLEFFQPADIPNGMLCADCRCHWDN